MRIIVRKSGLIVLALAGLFWLAPAVAQGEAVSRAPKLDVSNKGDTVRLLFTWDEAGRAQATGELINNVLVLRFADPLSIDPDRIAAQMRGAAALVRLDNDGRGLRIALKAPAKLLNSKAGRMIAFDLVSPLAKKDPDPVQDPEAQALQEAKAVGVRVSEMETLTRLSFDWPEPVQYDTVFRNGELAIRFDRPGTIDLKRFADRQAGWIKAIKADPAQKNLTILVRTDPEVRLADRAEGRQVIVDILEPASDQSASGTSKATATDAQAATAPAVATVPAGAVTLDAGAAGPNLSVPQPPPTDKKADAVTEVQAPKPLVLSDAAALAAKAQGASPAAPSAATGETAAQGTNDPEAEKAPPNLKAGNISTVLNGDTVTLYFPFENRPKAAVFRRGASLWLVFETAEAVDASALTAIAGAGINVMAAPVLEGSAARILRLRVPAERPAAVSAGDKFWALAIGPMAVSRPAQISLLRDVQADGVGRLRALVRPASDPVWVTDPEAGDRIAVVTMPAPVAGITTRRRMAELEVLESLQGLAIRPLADDIQVTAAEGAVIVARPRGLALSQEGPREVQIGGIAPDSPYPAPDFERWRRAGEEPRDAARTLLRKSAESPPGMSDARMALARFYVAQNLGAEAIGILRVITAKDQTAPNTPAFRVLSAIANIQLRRYREALEDLTLAQLANDPHAAFLRGLAQAGLGQHAEARSNLNEAARYFGAYPPDWQARGRLALAASALALGDAKEAERALSIRPPDLPPGLNAQFKFMEARVQEALGNTDSALALYGETTGLNHPESQVRADLHATLLKARTAKITPEQTIDALERIRFRWRGDEIEMQTLRALGQAYLTQGRTREGLESLKLAVRNFPPSDETRAVQIDMQKAFAEAFLSEKMQALPAVQALSLFYDFKDLTPPGLDGDAVIRKLAERLMDVDLLPQAAELLQHQVDNRLDGIPKASVAARLALVYLMDRKPEKALSALRGSRQVRLPDALNSERRLLEARALAELKRADEAIEALEGEIGAPGNRLRADVFWTSQRWQEAGQALEALAQASTTADAPLADNSRADILKAAVAFVLANDRGGVERLRARYGAKMADSPDARQFAVIVGKGDPGSADLRTMVRDTAGADTLDAFVADMKTRYGAGVSTIN
ncbi:MAG TPA: hypothetical protein DCL48_15410 [Alphaproteobacteria bacterium]|nr:hypothetical protein [Alphaproteobacteria bacterium]